MRKLIVSMNVTMNGFMAGEHGNLDWHFPFWNSELAHAWCQRLASADTILLGRNTYHAMSQIWSVRMDDLYACREDLVMADMMNRYTKLVYSKKLEKPGWKNTVLLQGELSATILSLKRQPGKDIIVYGSCRLASALLSLDLIDMLDLWIHPVAIPKGKALFSLGHYSKFLEVNCFSTGVVHLRYARKATKN